MKKISLNEELLHQIRLMNFDRSKTLLEHTPPKKKVEINKNDDPRMQFRGGDFKPQLPTFELPSYMVTPEEKRKKDNSTAIRSYNKIVSEIDGGWAPWKWGTDEDGLTEAILSIKNKEQYQILRKLLAKKYPQSAYPNSLLGFIQDEEFNVAQDPLTNDIVRSSAIPLGAVYQYETNDKYLRKMKNHLSQFNEKETFYSTGSIADKKTSYVNMILPPAASDLTHATLMGMSILLTIFSGGATAPLLLSLGFDIGDAYLWHEEGDDFMAGMSLFFGFLPGFQLAGPTLKAAMKELGLAYKEAKVMGGTWRASKPLSKEAKIVKEALENDKLRREALLNSIRAIIKIVFKEAKTVPILNIIFYLYEKGFLLGRFLTIFGLKCYGLFLTYEQIAKLMGIKEKEVKKQTEPDQLKDAYFDFSVNLKNKNLSSKDKTTFNDLTLLLQVALLSGGYEPLYVTESPLINWDQTKKTLVFNNSSNIKNVNVLTSTGKLIKTYKNKTGSKTFSLSNIIVDGSFIVDIETFSNKNDSVKFISNTFSQQTLTFGGKRLPEWGYYDEWTESAVRNFQKKHNLTFDGITGVQVGQKIKDLIFQGSISTSKISSTLKFVDDDLSSLQSKNKDMLTPEQAKPENLAKEIQKQKDTITNQIIDELKIPENINIDSLVNIYDDIERLNNN